MLTTLLILPLLSLLALAAPLNPRREPTGEDTQMSTTAHIYGVNDLGPTAEFRSLTSLSGICNDISKFPVNTVWAQMPGVCVLYPTVNCAFPSESAPLVVMNATGPLVNIQQWARPVPKGIICYADVVLKYSK